MSDIFYTKKFNLPVLSKTIYNNKCYLICNFFNNLVLLNQYFYYTMPLTKTKTCFYCIKLNAKNMLKLFCEFIISLLQVEFVIVNNINYCQKFNLYVNTLWKLHLIGTAIIIFLDCKGKLERNHYNKNTKLAEQQRKLVDEHFITRGKADYCSIDAIAHYSYDWAQNVHVPISINRYVKFI